MKKEIHLYYLIFSLILSFFANPSILGSSSTQDIPIRSIIEPSQQATLLLADGSMLFESYEYERFYPAGDEFGISSIFNYTTLELVTLESLSDSIISIDKEFFFEIVESHQEKDSISYSPIASNLIFLDDQGFSLGEPTSLSFTAERTVEKSSGIRTRSIVPFGASGYAIVSFYNSAEVYSSLFSVWSLGGVDSKSGFFDPDAPNWELGESVDEFLVVTGTTQFRGYDAVVVENNDIPQGASKFEFEILYERTTGLALSMYVDVAVSGSWEYQFSRQISEGLDLIDDGLPRVTATAGRIVNSTDLAEISFDVEENHFDYYNLYRNGTLFMTDDEERDQWSFLVEPTEDVITYELEIVDTLGQSSSASTWISFVASEAKKSDGDDSPLSIYVLFSSMFILAVTQRRFNRTS